MVPVQKVFPSFKTACFRFMLTQPDINGRPPAPLSLRLPRLPQPAHDMLISHLRSISLGSDVDEQDSPQENSGPDSEATSKRLSTINPQAAIPVKPIPPLGKQRIAPYCGRALAEWILIINECMGFFDKRKLDGVPTDRWIETPLLSVECYRGAPR